MIPIFFFECTSEVERVCALPLLCFSLVLADYILLYALIIRCNDLIVSCISRLFAF